MPLTRAWIGQPQLRYFTQANGGGGEDNFVGDYSAAPVVAEFTADFDLLIPHFSVIVKDKGKFKADTFGAGPPLVAGIEFKTRSPEGVWNEDGVMPGNVLRKNNDFLHWSEDIERIDWGEAKKVESGFAAHYEPYEKWGCPIYLPEGASVVTVLADDLSGLTMLRFAVVAVKIAQHRGD